MPFYSYIAIDMNGKKKKGEIEADSPRIVRVKLKEMALIPSQIKLLSDKSKISGNDFLLLGFINKFRQPSMKSGDLCLITRYISILVSSGMQIEESLWAVSQQCENKKHAKIICSVREKVCEGLSLADSMKKFPRVFDDLYVAMVASGEKSGHLDEVLSKLADYTESNQDIKSKVTQAMIYPVVLTVVAFGVISLLLSSVVPKVVEQFVHMKAALPTSTTILIALSDFVRHYGFLVLLFLVFCIVLFNYSLRYKNIKEKFHELLLKLPIVGKVSKTLNTARYAQTLSILHASSVPLIEAMYISSDVLTNIVAKSKLAIAAEKVREGKGLSRSLSETKLFSPMMIQMIASGEKSGELENMLARAASNQSNEFKRNVSIAISLFEPILIIVMAAIVLFIVISILQPLLQMNNIVGGK
ncbi:MAG: type II secretion system inner membrane protein GspF [Succinivibrionaceae bacterium]